MKILFEDNENTPSSKLLKESVVGEFFEFSKGNINLENKARKLLKSTDDVIVIMCDVVVDNIDTITKYNTLKHTFRGNERIAILPIVCIEYYILKMFDRLDLLDGVKLYYSKSLITFNWHSIVDNVVPGKDSIEKFYKSMCDNLKNMCLRNRFEEKKSYIGSFYIEECMCKTGHCRKNLSLTTDDKAFILISCLPLFPPLAILINGIEGIGVKCKSTTFEDVRKKQEKLYEKMHKDLGIDKTLFDV